jgi:signal peptidase II
MKKKNILNWAWQIGLALLIVVLDRVTKDSIMANHAVGEVFAEIPFVADFMYVQNTGAAFSLLSDNTMLLSLISILFVVALVIYKIVTKPQGFMQNLAIVLFFSGALGNAIDRVIYKFVVDFIDIKWFNFPVFNIADIAIVLGAVVAIIFVLFFDKSEGNKR